MGLVIDFPQLTIPARLGDLAVVCVDQLNDLWEILQVAAINSEGVVTAFWRAIGAHDHVILADAVIDGGDKYVVRRDALAEVAVSALRGRVFHGIAAARKAVEPFRVRP